ncbi:40-residue YVTN family beta-propeller repeat-containing protein [Streptomyces sp. 3213]|uniref:caspase, EACC1-associated type n=1 Tax=Streptomyces sp. 3213.3 TaxID=1855348 RepID=UPI00089C7E73|nr:caspase family protein [Streptomyces sp. 3213.3]SEC32309.1 40-residue YVTN family beta-propeller repeat-containing protein [Streptomyces sp. 3213] [Streptomyces sp. 3213.3]
MARRVALLIATYDHEDEGLRRLTAPAHDADALATVLKHPNIAGFEVTTLINEPHYRVGEAIADLYRDRRRDDLTLLYFTGHGLKDDDGRLYLATTNTRRDSLLFTSLPAEQVDQAMSGSMSRQNVLILDCCYSGAFPADGLTKADAQVHTLERFRGRGRTVLTASDATQYSFEGDQPHGIAAQSVFTRHLVAGLRDGSADLDGDGDITLDELYSYVHERVVDERPQQRPKKQDNVEGRIVIARNVNWSLPAHLNHALTSPIAADRLAALDGLDHLHRIGNDFVRRQVTKAFRRLAEDDSRLVSAAARARLGEPPQSHGDPVVTEAETEAGAGRESGLEPGVGREPGTPVPETTDEPVIGPGPAPAADPEPAPEPGTPPTQDHAARLLQDVKVLGAEVWHRTRDRLLALRLADITGLFPLGAAALLVAAIVLDVRSDYDHLSSGPGRDILWYVTAMAATTLAAGVCAFLPRTKELVGPGVTLGAAAASTWGQVYFWLQKPDSSELAFRLVLAGHIALALGACVTVYVLMRGRTVRFEFRRPGNPQTWIATGVGGVAAVSGAVALADELYRIARQYVLQGGFGYADPTWPYLAAAVSAVCVPLWAAMTAPRRFGLSLLAGWFGGACAIALVTYTRYDDSHPTIAVFAATLLALAGVAVFLARRSTTVDLVRLRRSVLITALAGIPLLAATGGVVADRLAHAPVLEAAPYFLALSPDGTRLYVTTALRGTGIGPDLTGEKAPGQLVIIDTATKRTVGKPLSLGKGLAGVAVAHDGDYAYVASAATDSVTVVSSLENTTVGKPILVADRPTEVTAAADGRRVLVLNSGSRTASVIDTTTNTTTSSPIPLGKSLTGAAVDKDGRHIYVSHGKSGTLSVVDTETGKTTENRGTIGFTPDNMAVSPNGRYLYAAGGTDPRDDGLTVIDTTTGQTTASGIPLDSGPHFGMVVSPNGQRAYVANFFGTSVSAIDTNTNAAVGRPIPVGSAPTAIAVSQDNRLVYVALPSDSKIAVFRSDNPGNVSFINIKPR